MADYLPQITTVIAAVDFLVIVVTIPWILAMKKESTSAVAWCLVVVLIPLLGFLLFLVFGYTRVYRKVKRKRRHRLQFRAKHPPGARDATRGLKDDAVSTYENLGELAVRLGAFPVSAGNRVTLYHETPHFFEELFAAIRDARKHVHLQYFIVQPDATGQRLIDLLTQKAKEGVEVRLLFDAVGSWNFRWRMLRPLQKSRGKCCSFLPLNPFRPRIQVNLRNHRKITVIDGRIAFTGGVNIGDEYLGKDPRFGYWRDEHLRLEGPAVAALQRIFSEDWNFAFGEVLEERKYCPKLEPVGQAVVQVIDGGPDQETNSIREMTFAAITSARQRLWLATPYFVPDSGILDALRLAGHLGVDVRLLVPQRPDHLFPHYASHYYWPDLLAAGVRIYEYSKGMMHSKIVLVDGQWASVGSANLDNRSLHLNFEANCILHSTELIADLEQAFQDDLSHSIRVDATAFAGRPFATRLLENGARLLSPVL